MVFSVFSSIAFLFFQRIVNYIRHNLISYDLTLSDNKGKVGKDEAYPIFKKDGDFEYCGKQFKMFEKRIGGDI